MSQKEMTAPAPAPAEVDRAEASEMALPTPDLSVLAEQPAAEPVKEEKPTPQELAETKPAPVGLVVALVVLSIVVAVVAAMWMVSPLMALLLGAGLIVVAVLAGAGWLAWHKFTRRTKKNSGRDGAGRTGGAGTSPRGDGGKPNGKSGGLWPFGRGGGKGSPGGGKPTGGAKSPTGSGKPTNGGSKPTGGKSNGGGKSGGSLWPFGRSTNGGKAPASGKAPVSGKPTGNTKAPAGSKPTGGSKPNGGGKPTGGGKPAATTKPTGGKPTTTGGGKPGGKDKSGSALLALLGLARAAKKDKDKTKPAGGDKAADQAGDKRPGGKDEPAKGRVRPAPGGHRPETVIDVDLDDITAPGERPGRQRRGGPSASAPRTAPPPFDSGATERSGWFDRAVPTSLRTAPHPYQTPVTNPFGGPEMSTTTTAGSVDQDAMRVANRYAAMVAKQETLMGRAHACREAADQYRRDARDNQESAENHKMAARTIRDVNVAAEHARAAREAEAEAAREILAARYYEEQAETYEAQARSIGF